MRSLLPVLSLFLIVTTACDTDEAGPDPEPVTDVVVIEEKEYPTVTIGNQQWTIINYEGPGGIPFDADNAKPEYGRYYTFQEIGGIELPEGWRIPTMADYVTLAKTHGVEIPSYKIYTDGIKALTSKTNWNNVAGNNSSGFNAFPAGYTIGDVSPIDGDIAEFWTSEGKTLSIQEGEDFTSLRIVFYASDPDPGYRFNVRFVKDL